MAATIIAQIASLLFLAVGLSGLINKNYYVKLMDDTFKNSSLVFCYGTFTMITSMLIINFHNIWAMNLNVLITIIGWLGLIKAFSILLFPNHVKSFSKSVFSSGISNLLPYTTILIAALFGYIGFM